jgi:hypothetical protein
LDIHPAHEPILSLKQAAVQLMIVTAGILIALSLEGVVEYVHHRRIVREARDMMRDEIEANRKELEQTLQRQRLQIDDLDKGISVYTAQGRGESPKIEQLTWMLNYRIAELHAEAHSTAQSMGALAFMDSREVRRYAAVYDAQEQFLRAQAAALADGVAAYGWAQQRDMTRAAPSDSNALADKLRQTSASVRLVGQFGAELQRDYENFLAGK